MTSKEFYASHQNLNCSETMIGYGNVVYHLNLSQTALESMAGFGGGLFEEDLCGVVSGGVAVISMVLTKQSLHLRQAVIEFKKRIKDAFGSIQCYEIKPIHRRETVNCRPVIIQAMDIMVDVINAYRMS